MLKQIRLLRNIGLFDSVAPGAAFPFAKLTLIYAENGRGKTTLAAILRSLRSGDATPIVERHRLGAVHPPHVIFKCADQATHTFENGVWSEPLQTLAIFDETFVSENVCAGIDIGTDQRQNLHELILGAQGVRLNAELQAHVASIEQHNRQIRAKEEAIPAIVRHGFGIDAFCALQPDREVEGRIREAERTLAAAQSAEAVQAKPEFSALELPAFDLDAISQLLTRGLPQLEIAAAIQVQAHLAHLGGSAERWVGEGVGFINTSSKEMCPFCDQPLAGLPLIEHYRAYFGAEYAKLKDEIETAGRIITQTHAGDVPAAFERAVRVAGERREFWAKFAAVPALDIDTAEIARAWKAAREGMENALAKKRASPLESIVFGVDALTAAERYRQLRAELMRVSETLTATNGAIAIVKEQARGANVATLTADLNKLKAVSARHREQTAQLCQSYLDEKAAKAVTESSRAQARAALDNYRQNIFPAYQTAINSYLQRLGADFRIAGVNSVNTRAGSSATYNVVINDHQVALTAETGPSFRNALSAGDRNALALAFFFASLEAEPGLADKIIVFDDPMTSLDEGRSLVTIHEMRQILNRVSQVIILSHAKPFLLGVWKSAPANERVAVRVSRAAVGSEIINWNVNDDSITEHDRRYARAVAYQRAADGALDRTVATEIRPMLEACIRVAYPIDFPPGALLGPFADVCQQRLGGAGEIMSAANTQELRALLDYANRFHHDTNHAYQTENINDAELRNFSDRTLKFIRRS